MVWSPSDFASLGAFDVSGVVMDRFRSAAVTSLSILCDHDRSSVLVGTASSDVYEMNRLTARVVLVHQAHSSAGVWALDAHPTDPDLMVTCGDDRTLRLWSVKGHKQVVARQMVRGWGGLLLFSSRSFPPFLLSRIPSLLRAQALFRFL
jgi:hypothetical protein